MGNRCIRSLWNSGAALRRSGELSSAIAHHKHWPFYLLAERGCCNLWSRNIYCERTSSSRSPIKLSNQRRSFRKINRPAWCELFCLSWTWANGYWGLLDSSRRTYPWTERWNALLFQITFTIDPRCRFLFECWSQPQKTVRAIHSYLSGFFCYHQSTISFWYGLVFK